MIEKEDKIFKIVKKYVDKMDYMGLLRDDCPDDEYNSESEKIANRIKSDMSERDIAITIEDVFARSFGEGVDFDDPSGPVKYVLKESEDCNIDISPKSLKAAKQIYNELKNNQKIL